MSKIKTTLMIEEALYDAIRLAAAKGRRSMSDVVAEATRAYLDKQTEPRPKIVLPSFLGKGELSARNSHSNAELLDQSDRLDDPSASHPRPL